MGEEAALPCFFGCFWCKLAAVGPRLKANEAYFHDLSPQRHRGRISYEARIRAFKERLGAFGAGNWPLLLPARRKTVEIGRFEQ